MPAPCDKRNNRIAFAFHDDEIDGITIVGRTGVCRAARILCERRSQRVEVKILDLLAEERTQYTRRPMLHSAWRVSALGSKFEGY